jgi:hypothetical protein
MLPKKVSICGVPYSVKLCDDNFDIDLHLGQIVYGKQEIRISKSASPEMQRLALIHEIVHGMLVLQGFGAESDNETFVQSMAAAIGQSFNVKGESAG